MNARQRASIEAVSNSQLASKSQISFNDQPDRSIDDATCCYRYTTLTEIAILNSDPSKDTEANGYLAVYDGETLAFERSDLVYRTNASVFFSSIMFQSESLMMR